MVTLGWITGRLAISDSILDQAVGIPVVVGGVANLIGCSLASDSNQVQSAFFGLSFSLWVTYAYFVFETITSSGYGVSLERVLFGNMLFPLVFAGTSMALLTVQVLLSAAALGPNLWKASAWVDSSLLLLTGFHAALAWDAPDGLGLSCAILAADLLLFGSLWLRLQELRPGQLYLYVFTDANIEIVHAVFACVAGVLAVGLAAMAKTAMWAFPLLVFALLLGIVLRTVYWKQSTEEVGATATLGFAGAATPAASAPATVPVTMAPPNASRFCLEPIYNFQTQSRAAAGKSKGL